MHELSIAQSILTIAGNTLPQNNHAAITGVGLQIGELSGIERESLEFAFSVIKKDTILELAGLQIETIPGEAVCTQCHTVFPIHHFGTACPHCNSYFINITKGREMKVLNITVDE